MAATVADLLGLMEMVNNEFDFSANSRQETLAIRALVSAQHYFETVAAEMPRALQSTINIGTVANQETTLSSTLASTLLRFDALWFLDDTTGLPVYKLKRISEIGGHVPSMPWPLQLSMATGTGSPRGYYATLDTFYWLPKPDAAHSVRIYGMVEQPEFVDRASAFNYPLRCKLPIASFASKLMSMGTDDDTDQIDALTDTLFRPLLRGLKKFDRTEPQSRYYNDEHTT